MINDKALAVDKITIMALNLWLGLSFHLDIHRNRARRVWYVFVGWRWGRKWRKWRVELGLRNIWHGYMTPIYTDLNVFQACSDAVMIMMIIYCRFIYQLHCTVFALTLNDSPIRLITGCFLGCHWRIWGADLHSRSVSWHGRFHSECYEWPPSDPVDETWEKEIEDQFAYI